MSYLLLPALCVGLFFGGPADDKKPVAHVKGTTLYMEDVQTDEILELRRTLFEKLERAIAEKATVILENHPHDDDPNHMLEHFRNSVKDGEVELLIDVPPARQYSVALDADQVGAEAEVVILEFIDSQCPYCKELFPAVDRLKNRMRDALSVVTYHYPLPSHPDALLAAQAMECARERGGFDRYRRALVERLDHQSKDDLLRYAGQLRLPDTAGFAECLDEGRYVEKIKEQSALAESLGIDATPSLIIGRYADGILTGERIVGAVTFEELQDLVARFRTAPAKPVPAPAHNHEH